MSEFGHGRTSERTNERTGRIGAFVMAWHGMRKYEIGGSEASIDRTH